MTSFSNNNMTIAKFFQCPDPHFTCPSNEVVDVKCLDLDRCDGNLSEVIGSRRMGWEILGVKDNEENRSSLYAEITNKALPF
ncbi:hypothetical protein FEM48_Zijuj09G0107600 [Ziziphus jujuba var. spinosa]|uniref:Uncharacterized protein n=1 Tax=Ziziphus jujuba var. spinosa TaxID=714518 RepID=A0A978USJ7_ZIZJJ|nr:hypothetical protein FEM48_Zijuj09G0107600 [Ziziphus jujuba var. spinosa]